MGFTTGSLPEMRFGTGTLNEVGGLAAEILGKGKALIIADSFLKGNGVVASVIDSLANSAIAATVFTEFAGEPRERHIMAASEQARRERVEAIIAIGGGSALDIGKIVASTAQGGEKPSHYALASNPMPDSPLPSILIPTTAGTGSEANGTAVFSNGDGKKVWLADRQAKARLALLDPALTLSLPANLTAWCGMDAFVHAFEAATSRRSHSGGQLFAHEALRLIAPSLELAVSQPDNQQARSNMLLGSFYAGFAIESCGTAIAHNISHSLARFAPIHHGFATAIAFETTLGWLVKRDNPTMAAAAEMCGLTSSAELPAFVTKLMDRSQIDRRLPKGFETLTPADLCSEMLALENKPMRDATPRKVSNDDLWAFAEKILTLGD